MINVWNKTVLTVHSAQLVNSNNEASRRQQEKFYCKVLQSIDQRTGLTLANMRHDSKNNANKMQLTENETVK